ncbi:ThiF family adenylyltransferase [Romboutsia sp.]|uniref:ThiF family adenylyltransferase n=1 Tax=Romboutsia sp. TaxID=1965302 RepID=UPI003F383614
MDIQEVDLDIAPRLMGVKGYRWFVSKKIIMVTIGGMGSISSWLTLLLSRTIPKLGIVAYDFDHFDERNAGGQFFLYEDVGKNKIEAVNRALVALNGEETYIIGNSKFEEGSEVTDVTFSGFDNIEARVNMFNSWLKKEKGIFIDGRIYKENYQVYAVQAGNIAQIEAYQEILKKTDIDIPDTDCTTRNTTFIAMGAAEKMTTLFLNYLENKLDPEFSPAVVPFKYEWSAQSFTGNSFYL